MGNNFDKYKFYVVNTIQNYARFIKNEAHMCEMDLANYDWIDIVKEYYYKIDDEILKKAELEKNEYCFEKLFNFKITDEILKSSKEDLKFFDF